MEITSRLFFVEVILTSFSLCKNKKGRPSQARLFSREPVNYSGTRNF
ncbi:MAG: hypothetical protein LUG18_09200 [Candidatus Azobacteroides sp.]|nr:hypothetical protein [Candidatus Azobacteroides sp.]